MEITIERIREKFNTSPVYQGYIEAMKAGFEDYAEKPIPSMPYDSFTDFFVNGNRMRYEGGYYFLIRDRLVKAAVLYMVYSEEKYLKMLEEIIWTICNEFTWALPAHIPGEHGYRVEEYRHIIDLFAAETGFMLSEIYSLIGEDFSVILKKRLELEINDRIIDNFLKNNHGFELAVSNWSAVCGGAVGATFIHMAPKEKFDMAFPRIEAALDKFLSSYFDDGVCREGPSYWEYGFGSYVYFAELLRRYTDGAVDYFANEKIKRIAAFQQIVYLRDDITVCFADSSMRAGYPNGLSRFLANEYGTKIPPTKYGKTYDFHKNIAGYICWHKLIRDLLWDYDVPISDDTENKQVYMEDSQWYIKTTDKFAFAAKGGNNDEPHNHNDVGNFIFVAGDEIAIADIGSGEYTRDYFTEKRYTIVNPASFGHSVPEINGEGQLPGLEHKAEVLHQDENIFELQLKDAYGIEELESYVRHFNLNDDGFVLTDEFEGNIKSVKERFVSIIPPQLEGNRVKIGKATIIFDNDVDIVTSKLDYKGRRGGDKVVYFIDALTNKKTFVAKFVAM